MPCPGLRPVLIYICDLLHQRGNLWGLANPCAVMETCCEAVSVSICHFVAWLLNFTLVHVTVHLSVHFHLFLWPFFPPSLSLPPSRRLCLPFVLFLFPSPIGYNSPKLSVRYQFSAPLRLYYTGTDWSSHSWQFISICVWQNRTFVSFRGSGLHSHERPVPP